MANAQRVLPVRVALVDEHRIVGHVGDDVPLALILRLTRRDDVHDEMLDAAVGPSVISVCRCRTRGKRSTSSLVSVLPLRVTLSTEIVSWPSRATNP